MSVVICGRHHVSRSQCACPPTKLHPKGNYPINTKKRSVNAHARFNQAATRKCRGGLKKIRNAEYKFGVKAERLRR